MKRTQFLRNLTACSVCALGLLTAACSSDTTSTAAAPSVASPTSPNAPPAAAQLPAPLADTTAVKRWLTSVIEHYTNSPEPDQAFNQLRLALTDDYYQYKQDAINLEYDTVLTEKAFQQKWRGKYNPEFVGNGGFLISAQDNGKVDVPVCRFIRALGPQAALYKVVIRDVDNQTTFKRDIQVVAQGKKRLINDVIEYD